MTAMSDFETACCNVQKVVDQEPAATMLQLDAVRGNVNTVVNDNIRTSYQVCTASRYGILCQVLGNSKSISSPCCQWK